MRSGESVSRVRVLSLVHVEQIEQIEQIELVPVEPTTLDLRHGWHAGWVVAAGIVVGIVGGGGAIAASGFAGVDERLDGVASALAASCPAVTVDGANIDPRRMPESLSIRPDGTIELRQEAVLPGVARLSWSVVIGQSTDAQTNTQDEAPPEGLASPPPVFYWVVTTFAATNLAPTSTAFNFAYEAPLVDALVQRVGGGAFGLLVDANGDGASISAPEEDAIYTSLIDETFVGQAMIDPFSLSAPAGATNWLFGSHGNPIPSDPAPSVTTGYGLRLSYVLSAGDSSEITSIVVISQ